MHVNVVSFNLASSLWRHRHPPITDADGYLRSAGWHDAAAPPSGWPRVLDALERAIKDLQGKWPVPRRTSPVPGYSRGLGRRPLATRKD